MGISFQSCAVPTWMDKLQNGRYVSKKKLDNVLHSLMSKDEASQTVEYGIKMGILVPKKKCEPAKGKPILLAFSQNIKELCNSLQVDLYCFECHLPGSAEKLKKCLSCDRSFHRSCQRKNPSRPNYVVPADKNYPLNESDLEELSHDRENVSVVNGTITPAPSCALEADTQFELDFNSNINKSPAQSSFKYESDSDDKEVLFVSEQPARRRKRSTPFVKYENEQPSLSSDNNELELCTACRLAKLPDFLIPPRVSISELNCLLQYSWQKHQSWLTTDIRKHMDQHWSKRDADLVKSALFKNDLLGAVDIKENIEMLSYKQITDFLVDLLDLQHNFGVFYGSNSEAYDETKYLLRDISHDMHEIRRCTDCYRYSNETHNAFWFAKPCFQRHELVYAKTQGSPYWPAKVIRVITKKSSIYDVRFFGGTHSRSLVSETKILPIDAKIPNFDSVCRSSRNLSMAMRELRCHEMLLNQPIELFDFYADPEEAENLINKSLPHCMKASELTTSAKRPRVHTPASTKRFKITDAPISSVRKQPMRRCSLARSAVPEGLETVEMPASSAELMQQLVLLQEQLKAKEQQIETAKRQKWCQRCLQLAKFDCCFNASYCSDKCKRSDKKRHQRSCNVKSRK